jgi:hypothetical protein
MGILVGVGLLEPEVEENRVGSSDFGGLHLLAFIAITVCSSNQISTNNVGGRLMGYSQ